MNCENYQAWMEEAALGGLGPLRQARLHAHLARCVRCRQALAREQRLLAAIDGGLVAGLHGEPSPEFAARVRARLRDEGVRMQGRARWPLAIWAPVTAAALAILLLAVWLARRTARTTAPAALAGQAASGEQAKIVVPRASTSPAARPASSKAKLPRARGRRPVIPGAQAPQFEVLVEPGQWAAVVKLYNSVWAPEVSSDLAQPSLASGPATASGAAQPAEDELVLKPIEIKPLDVGVASPDANAAEALGSAEDN